MKSNRWLGIAVLVFLSGNLLAQDDSGFIYGKVITKNGNTYVGQIRWGGEEIFWNDIFNSVKTYRNSSLAVKASQYDRTTENRSNSPGKWELLKIWDDTYTGSVHQFTCRFGDIKALVPNENGLTEVWLKNDLKIKVDGGSNDIFAEIQVMDYELGPLTLSWDHLNKVEFFDAPSLIKNKPGNPLFGQVVTSSGSLEGFIQWDHDERIDTDVLDGYIDGNSLQIDFKDIACMSRAGCSTVITPFNGNEVRLGGTNDVDCSNKGIIISKAGTGKIEVPWQHFESLCFTREPKGSGEPYRNYPKPKRLYGTVKTLEGQHETGILIFDNDESWDFEHLEGNVNGLKYVIPFRNILLISPKNSTHSYVTLKNGERLLLGELRDVSYQNKGILVFKDYEEKPLRVEWTQIDEISFK